MWVKILRQNAALLKPRSGRDHEIRQGIVRSNEKVAWKESQEVTAWSLWLIAWHESLWECS